MIWEYYVNSVVDGADSEQLTVMCNRRGSEGWELVGVYASRGVATYIFKRPKVDGK